MLEVTFHPGVERDLLHISTPEVQNIEKAINNKLRKYPELFGTRLRGNLKDFWKLRIGDYRIVYEPRKNEVFILAIGNRKDIYKLAERRV